LLINSTRGVRCTHALLVHQVVCLDKRGIGWCPCWVRPPEQYQLIIVADWGTGHQAFYLSHCILAYYGASLNDCAHVLQTTSLVGNHYIYVCFKCIEGVDMEIVVLWFQVVFYPVLLIVVSYLLIKCIKACVYAFVCVCFKIGAFLSIVHIMDCFTFSLHSEVKLAYCSILFSSNNNTCITILSMCLLLLAD